MGQIVHQIWIGPPMPQKETEWVEGIRKASTAAGWEYHLYDLRGLVEALPGDLAMMRLAEYGRVLNINTRLAGLISDYARIALLAYYGGLYLDTDWYFTGGDWPEFPQKPDIYAQGINDHWTQGNGIFYVPPGAIQLERLQNLYKAAAEKVVATFSESDACTTAEEWQRKFQNVPWLPYFLGPVWLYTQVGDLTYLPRELASFSFWGGNPKLVHVSQGRWAVPYKKDATKK